MYILKIFPIVAACLLLSCVELFMIGSANDEVAFHDFADSLKERRGSDWPISDNMEDLVGVYKYSLVSEEVKIMGLSALTDISDCDVVMDLYKNGNGRIALYDERSKGPNPTSKAFDLEWCAEKIDSKDLGMDIYQGGSDCYLVQIAFYKHFDIEFESEYIFIQSANDSYIYESGKARYDNAKDWLMIKNTDPVTDESLTISTIKLE